MHFFEFAEPKPVVITSKHLPRGVRTKDRNALALGFLPSHDNHYQWLCVFNETGEIVSVPNHEVRFADNWSLSRRGK